MPCSFPRLDGTHQHLSRPPKVRQPSIDLPLRVQVPDRSRRGMRFDDPSHLADVLPSLIQGLEATAGEPDALAGFADGILRIDGTEVPFPQIACGLCDTFPDVARMTKGVSHTSDYSGIEHLEQLTRLESLGLRDAQITDAGLKHLKGLTRLNCVYHSETQITDAGVEVLQEVLLYCLIDR